MSTDSSKLASEFFWIKQPRAFLGGVVVYHKVGFSILHIRQTSHCIHHIVLFILKLSVLLALDVLQFFATLVCLVDATASWKLCEIRGLGLCEVKLLLKVSCRFLFYRRCWRTSTKRWKLFTIKHRKKKQFGGKACARRGTLALNINSTLNSQFPSCC